MLLFYTLDGKKETPTWGGDIPVVVKLHFENGFEHYVKTHTLDQNK